VLLRPKRQVTFPKAPCEQAGIVPGDRLRVRAEGSGRIVFEKIDAPEELTKRRPSSLPTRRGERSSAR